MEKKVVKEDKNSPKRKQRIIVVNEHDDVMLTTPNDVYKNCVWVTLEDGKLVFSGGFGIVGKIEGAGMMGKITKDKIVKCPVCSFQLPESNGLAQKEHMEENHPEIIIRRLRAVGMPEEAERFAKEKGLII